MATTSSIILGDYFEKFVNDQVNDGRFQNASEVVRAGLQKLEQDDLKLDTLRQKLQTAEQSAVIDDFDTESFLAEMHKKHLK